MFGMVNVEFGRISVDSVLRKGDENNQCRPQVLDKTVWKCELLTALNKRKHTIKLFE